MKAGAVVFLVFVGLAALAMFSDLLDSEDMSAGVLGLLPRFEEEHGSKAAAKEAKPLTVEERVAAFEDAAAALRRRVRDVVDSTSALAGTDTALAAILARLDDLAGAAGRLPRDDVAARLETLERDLELREFMVTGTKEVVDKGPDEVAAELDRLRGQVAELRTAARGKEDLLARLKETDDDLAGLATPPKGGEIEEMDAVRKARARFDRGATELRARLG